VPDPSTMRRAVLPVLLALGGLAGGVLGVRLLIRADPSKAGENPYEYRLDSFRNPGPEPPRWAETAPIDTGMREPRGIAADARGGLAVAGDANVVSFDHGGKRTGSFDLGGAAFCVAVDPGGDLVLGMKDHVEVWGTDGARKESWASLGEEARLTSIAAGREQVVAADAGNRLVWRFDRSGVLAGTVGEEPRPGGTTGFVVPSPFFDAAFGPDGSLWVADPGRQRVERYSPEGTWKSSWGRASMEIDGFCG